MIIVTNDYGCGTSSSILDYELKNVCVVNEADWEKVFDLNDDVFFVGHDFLMYMWDTQEKVERWKSFPHAKIIWCFERIDAILQPWLLKSHHSLNLAKQFADEIYACDEDDCTKYGLKWLPQWASKKFFDKRGNKPQFDKILFSGQAQKIEYNPRTELLNKMLNDPDMSRVFQLTNVGRTLSWNEYIDNFLKYSMILNPVGTFKGLNTRAYEAIYSGRILLQQTYGEYSRHQELLRDVPHVIFFNDFEDLRDKLSKRSNKIDDDVIVKSYENNSIYARMKGIGVDII